MKKLYSPLTYSMLYKALFTSVGTCCTLDSELKNGLFIIILLCCYFVICLLMSLVILFSVNCTKINMHPTFFFRINLYRLYTVYAVVRTEVYVLTFLNFDCIY